MEPLRTKRYIVLLAVFSLGLGISFACTPRQGNKPEVTEKKSASEVSKRGTIERPAEHPGDEGQSQITVEKELSEGVADKPLQKSIAPKEHPAEKQVAEGSGVGKKPVPPAPKPAEADKTAVADADKKFDSGKADSAKAMPPEPPVDDLPRSETPEETARRLGPPLVEHPEKLLPLDKVKPIWLDKPGKRLIMVGEVCQREAPLEMFVCLWRTKEHEAVLTARVPAKAAHAGLLALGAKVGKPVQFVPKYVPASGSVIDIDVIWKDAGGKIRKQRGQDWIRNFRTKKPMEFDWVFGGSGLWTNKKTGQTHYQAESGDFICVSNFSTAMLDLPVKSTDSNEGLMFEALTENIPPLGTPVTIVLKPRLDKSGK
ncbi:MAG: hypothetical protein JXM70_01280 [Pirellulales bacterium]|nr:hypothetical protein [Pirellulales bacterium]